MACSVGSLFRPLVSSSVFSRIPARTTRLSYRPLPVLTSTKPARRAFSQTMTKDDHTADFVEAPNGDRVPEKEQWKYRAPYRIHDKNDSFNTRVEGNCHCGKVKFQLSRDTPLASKLCHCTTCQVQHAAPFQWAAIFHKEDINFEHGHHDLEWYDPTTKSTEHQLPCKVRCSYCHSPIMDEGRNMILLFPSLLHLDTQELKDQFKPRCHMFYTQRVMDVPDGLPKWTGINQDSDLIEDSPPEMIMERERQRKKNIENSVRPGGNPE